MENTNFKFCKFLLPLITHARLSHNCSVKHGEQTWNEYRCILSIFILSLSYARFQRNMSLLLYMFYGLGTLIYFYTLTLEEFGNFSSVINSN